MSIEVLRQGIADSIQDGGRYGHQQAGINPNGAMDFIAMQAANILVGNDLNEAVLEMHFPASVFLFKKDALIALTGADFAATVNDAAIPINTPIIVEKNAILKCTKPLNGARCYLAVRYGFVVQEFLNSKSTNITAAFGGLNGTYLKKGDILSFNQSIDYSNALKQSKEKILPWKIRLEKLYTTNNQIRIIIGNEYSFLNEVSTKKFHSSAYTITLQSNRMAYRMKGEALHLQENIPMISSAVTKGTIQLLPDGQLVVLMADHQTTGGYPRIGHVISADIPKLAQLKPNEQINFVKVDQQKAVDVFLHQHNNLIEMKDASDLQLNHWLANFNIK